MFRHLTRFLRWITDRRAVAQGRVPRQIVVKLKEGKRLTVDMEPGGGIRWTYGGEELDSFDDVLSVSSRKLIQSFPRFIRRLIADHGEQAIGPNRYSPYSLDLFLRLVLQDPEDDMSGVLKHVRRIRDVEFAHTAAPLAGSPSNGTYVPEFGYVEDMDSQYRAGVDAEYAWQIDRQGSSGRGRSIHVCVMDAGFCDEHKNIPAIPDNRVYGVRSTDPDDERHGAMVLGVLAAQFDRGDGMPGGTRGLCPEAELHFGGTGPLQNDQIPELFLDMPDALDEVLGCIPDGTVLALEVQVRVPKSWRPEDDPSEFLDPVSQEGKGLLPAEANSDVLDALSKAASQRNITIVEAAGNTGGLLVRFTEGGTTTWDPDCRDSGAILVGAGSPADQSHIPGGNHGPRVDCQGWGKIHAPYCPGDESGQTPLDVPDNEYTDDFSMTSAATAIVAGAAACLQGAYRAWSGTLLPPYRVRRLFRDKGLGTPQPPPPDPHIGPLPDLAKILRHLGIVPNLILLDGPQIPPEMYMSDLPFWLQRSPDLLLTRGDGRAFEEMDPAAVEIPSTSVGERNLVQLRVRNVGKGGDRVRCLLCWSHPSSYMHPLYWLPFPFCIQLEAWTEAVKYYSAPWDAPVSLLGQDIALIGAVWPRRDPDPPPTGPSAGSSELPGDVSERAAMSTEQFLALRGNPRVAFRSAVWKEAHPGGRVALRYHLRGLTDRDDEHEVALLTELPEGTRVAVEPISRGPLTAVGKPAVSFPYEGLLLRGSARFQLPALAEIPLALTVTLPQDIAPGTYETVLRQRDGAGRDLGRITYIFTVPAASRRAS